MVLKWMGCLAALTASAGLAVAQTPHSVDSTAPRPDATNTPPPQVTKVEGGTTPSPLILVPDGAPPATGGVSLFDPYDDSDGCYRIRANADYLRWHLKQDHLPQVFGSLPAALDGVRPLPPGSILPVFVGDFNNLDYHSQSGERFGVEFWLDPEEHCGFDTDYFRLEPHSLHTAVQSNPNGLPILGPTFGDPVTGLKTILLFSEPGLSTSALAFASEVHFQGWEVNYRTRVPATFNDRTELLVGFRTVQFDQDIDITGSSIAAPGVTAPFNGNPNAVSFSYLDSFHVQDNFYGAQIGVDSESSYRCFFINLKAKIAVGAMDETVRINGATNFLAPVNFTVPGGVLAQPSNIGSHHHDVCTFLPELSVNAGVLIGRHARAFVGYDFLYIDQLQRVGTTIGGVDATQVPSLQAVPNAKATRPAFQFEQSRFWADGLNTGVELRF